jgi:hypothetical protein
MSRSGAEDAADAASLSPRDRALLQAVSSGRCTVERGPGGTLLVDGACCADQFALHRFTAAGWVRTSDPPGGRGGARRVELTPDGQDLLAGRHILSARSG